MPVIYKTEPEIDKIRASSILVSKTLAMIAQNLKPGVTGKQLDTLAEAFIRDHGAVPAFKGYDGFPGSLCISPNNAIVHGLPNNKAFTETDIISIDCGVLLNGFFGDSAYTFAMAGVEDENILNLLRVTLSSLYKGIEKSVAGNRVGDISYAIQSVCEKEGFSVVRELVGHGVGRKLHEDPEIPNFGKSGSGPILKEGLVIAIEPMINLGRRESRIASDKWTFVTVDGKPSAHYEHTLVVRKNNAEILSNHAIIHDEEKNNSNLINIS